MANRLYNLARMSTATTGTGTITLGSAVSGYLTFALAGVANGDVVSYAIKDGSNSEIGTGTYTSAGTTLTRSVTKSTNANAAISLSGTAEVFITVRAEDVLAGTSTNDSAAAGYIGELIESEVLVGSAVSLSTGTDTNVTSISLTAGDWDVWGNVTTSSGATTVLSRVVAWINTVSATQPTKPGKGAFSRVGDFNFTAGSDITLFAGQRRVSISGTTTVYLGTSMAFTTSTMAAYGYLGARRAR